MKLKKFINSLLDFILPIRCLGCQNYSASYLCSLCLLKIKISSRLYCIFCGKPSFQGQTCPRCLKKHFLNKLWFAAAYDDPLLKRCLWSFKYRFVSQLAPPLSELVINFLKERGLEYFLQQKEVVILPVPLQSARWRWRSYNQAELLARLIAKNYQLPLRPGYLQRVARRQPQAEIKDPQERVANITGAFACPSIRLLKNKMIILIDDICTTGSTLDECAKVLKQAGAQKVIGLVVAKG